MLNVIRKCVTECILKLYTVHWKAQTLTYSNITIYEWIFCLKPPMSHSHIQLFKRNMYLQAEHFDSLQEEVV